MNVLIDNYPLQNSKCLDESKCQVRQFIRSVYRKDSDSAYAPYQKEKLENMVIDKSVQTLEDLLEALYGGHICTVKDVREKKIKHSVYQALKKSYNLDECDAVYEVCLHRWFRCFFSIVPDVKAKVIKSWHEAKENNVLRKYFDGKNYLDLPMPDDSDIKCVIVYNDDYDSYAASLLGPEQLFGNGGKTFMFDDDWENRGDDLDPFRSVENIEDIGGFICDLGLSSEDTIYTEMSDPQAQELQRIICKRVINNDVDKKRWTIYSINHDQKSIYLYVNSIVRTCMSCIKNRRIIVTDYGESMGFRNYENFGKLYFHFDFDRRDSYYEGRVSGQVMYQVLSHFPCFKFSQSPFPEPGPLVRYEKFKNNVDDYVIRRRLVGQRLLLFLFRGTCYLLNEKCKMHVLPCEMSLHHDDEAIFEVVKVGLTLYIVDCVKSTALYTRVRENLPLRMRYSFVMSFRRCLRVIERYHIKVENYFPVDRFSYLREHVGFSDIDGIVFAPKLPRPVLKSFRWRPLGDTAIFKIMVQDDEQWLFTRTDRDLYIQHARIVCEEYYNDRNVECFFDGKVWKIVRIINFEKYPNGPIVARNVVKFGSQAMMEKFEKDLKRGFGPDYC